MKVWLRAGPGTPPGGHLQRSRQRRLPTPPVPSRPWRTRVPGRPVGALLVGRRPPGAPAPAAAALAAVGQCGGQLLDAANGRSRRAVDGGRTATPCRLLVGRAHDAAGRLASAGGAAGSCSGGVAGGSAGGAREACRRHLRAYCGACSDHRQPSVVQGGAEQAGATRGVRQVAQQVSGRTCRLAARTWLIGRSGSRQRDS